MGNNQSISWQKPLRCILENWKLFDPLRRSLLKVFFATLWPWCPSGDKGHWPEDGSLNYNTILQLHLFCKRQGKWIEIPYVQIFFQLRDMKELCLKYGIVVCPKSESTRQMVLGTDNQEKEAPPWSLISHDSRVAWCSFLISKHDPVSGSSYSTKANTSMSLSWNWRKIQTNTGA